MWLLKLPNRLYHRALMINPELKNMNLVKVLQRAYDAFLSHIQSHVPESTLQLLSELGNRPRQSLCLKGYPLSTGEARALGCLIDLLGLTVRHDELLARLEQVITENDVYNLIAVLNFVLGRQLVKRKDSLEGMVVRAADLDPKPAIEQREKLTRRNILFITGEFPDPVHGGGGRVFDLIQMMGRDNNIYLYTWLPAGSNMAVLEQLHSVCCKIAAVDYYDFLGHPEKVREFIGDVPVDIVHYEWPRSLSNYDPSLGRHHIFTFMEAVSLRLLMDMAFEQKFSSRWLELVLELLRTLKIELVDADQVDALTVVTRKDGEFYARLNPTGKYIVLNHGVNFQEFSLPDQLPEKHTLTFVGNFIHYPNVDAIKFFFDKVFDTILSHVSDVSVYLVGAAPPKTVRDYHDGRRVIVTGTVDDIRPYIQRASVCLAPLVSGAGLRGKVIQYASLKRVCVATSIAATDLQFENAKEIFIADDPAEFAERVVFLLHHPELAHSMSQRAYAKACMYYDSRNLVQQLYQIYSHLDDTSRGPNLRFFKSLKAKSQR
jgi:glycosyltransferase involved in cell wall biosynthesis